MKFSCDSCHAQYMISDEKVGAAGVRVRCKKCGNVIHVKKVEAEAPPPEDATVVMTADKLAKIQDQLNAARGMGPEGAPSPPKVTADEIGQAFDSMFSDRTAEDGAVQPSQPPIAAPPVGGLGADADTDRAETRVLTAGDMQRMSSDLALPAPPPGSFENEMTVAAPYARPPSRPDSITEWFVAIREEQVGPLTPAGVKERWDRGEVGPDTLVWCSGLPDWKPLSSVDELAQLVAPAPTATVRNGSLAPSSPSRAPVPPSADAFKPEDSLAEFKPSAASALASLASMAQEEMDAAERAKAAPKPPESEPEPARVARSSPSRADLFADLPPPDAAPMASAPIAVTAASSFGARAPVPDAYEAPPRRGAEPAFGRPGLGENSNLKLIAISVGVAVVILGLVGTLVWALYFKPQREAEERRIAELAAAAEAAKKAPVPAPAPVAPAPPVPAPVAPSGAVAAKPPVAPTPAPPAPVDDRKHHGGSGKHPGHHGGGEESSAGPTSNPTPAPAPPPAASGGGNGDDFLNSGNSTIDKEFAKELDGNGDSAPKAAASSHHQVYIPPPPGGDLPQTLGQSDVMEVIVEHKGNFARCKSDHPGGGGTVVMHWRIRPDGHTADVKRTGGDLDNAPLAKCIQTQVSKLHFGQYRGPPMAPIDFPFNF